MAPSLASKRVSGSLNFGRSVCCCVFFHFGLRFGFALRQTIEPKIEHLQGQNTDFRFFLARSNELARCLGISLRQLAPQMGLSVASLFGYRSGKLKITPKAWKKLEQAERDISESLKAPFSGRELCYFRIRSGLEYSDFSNLLGIEAEQYLEMERGLRHLPDNRDFWVSVMRVIGEIHKSDRRRPQGGQDSSDTHKSDLEFEEETAAARLLEGDEELALDLTIRLLNEYRENRDQVLHLFKASSIIQNIGLSRIRLPPQTPRIRHDGEV